MSTFKKRCSLMVSGSIYRAAGQCAKAHGLKTVKLQDRRILACPHHFKVLVKSGVVK